MHQYGFQETSSTYMTIANVVQEITASLDSHKTSLGVFIDLSKAFGRSTIY